MRCRLARLALLLACASSASCAADRAATRPASVPVPNLAGVWEGVFQVAVVGDSGPPDSRIERHVWRLDQRGKAVTGSYLVELTMISGDGRPFACSGEPTFSTLTRLELRGRADLRGVVIEEIGPARAAGRCNLGTRAPARYRAAVVGNVLTVSDGDRALALHRLPAAQAARALVAFPLLESAADADRAAPETAAAEPANVEGLWVWEHRGLMPTGDEKAEREEWHLTQDGTRISGYYDRSVRQTSTDGHAYRCNSALDFQIVTRFHVTGEVRGNSLVLRERTFEILEGSPCDDGRRRLEAYQGQAANGEIRLRWGVGTQVLRRGRPNVPTQRF